MTSSVLFVHHGGGIAGSSVSMLQLAAALDRERFDPTVVFTAQGPILEFAREMDIPVQVMHMPSAFMYSTHAPLRLRTLAPFVMHFRRTVATARRLVQRMQPDLVHLNTSVLVPVAIGVKQTRTPLVWHVREPAGPNRVLRRWHVNRIRSLSDHVIVNSHYVGRNFPAVDSVSVIHNAVDGRSFAPRDATARARARTQFGVPQDSPVVGIVGTVQTIKGHYFLVEAAASLVRQVPGVRFLIVAGGVSPAYARSWKGRLKNVLGMPLDSLEGMRRDIAQRGLEQHFVFTGFRSDIPVVMSAMDVLAFPSLVPEGFGRPLIEGMAMGLPVVATDIGPTREILGEGTGLLVRPDDPAELARALGRLVTDEELAGRMGDAGRRRFIAHFEMAPMIDRVEGVYEQVLSRGRAASVVATPVARDR